MRLEPLVEELNELIENKQQDRTRPGAFLERDWDSNCRILYDEQSVYIYAPDESKHKQIRDIISNYLTTNNLNSIVYERYTCKDIDCHGHAPKIISQDKEENEHIHLNKLPDRMSGIQIYFMNSEMLKAYEIIRNANKN